MADYTFGPGSESVAVQVLVPAVGGSRWDQVVWGPATAPPAVGVWSDLTWQTVDCQITEAAWTWACQRDVGILSVAEAGSLDLQTFDPDRQLDPANVTGPFFRQVRPGTAIRILGPDPIVLSPVWTGWVDELSYDVANQTGRLRCTDPIALMAQTAYRDPGFPSTLPNTLRARIRRVLVDAQIADLVPFAWLAEFEEDDPPVAPFVPPTGDPPKVWKVIQDACADALALAWIDGAGRLQVSDWGAFPVSQVGLGCGPAEDPSADWVEYLTTIEFEQNAEGIRNRVVTVEGGVETHPLEDRQSIFTYGVREYRVDRAVPDRTAWGTTILADRSDASLTVNALESRPADLVELSNLLEFIRGGPAQTRLRDDNHPPLIDLEATVIGLEVRVSPDGWVFSLVTSLSRAAYDALEPPGPPSGVIDIVQEAEGLPGDPSGAITLPMTPVPGNVLLLWHVVDTDFGPIPPGFSAHPSGPVSTGVEPITRDIQQTRTTPWTGGGAQITTSFDTPPTPGNTMLAFVYVEDNTSGVVTTAGWTEIETAIGSEGTGHRIRLWRKVATVSEAAVVVSATDGGAARKVVLVEVNGTVVSTLNRDNQSYLSPLVGPATTGNGLLLAAFYGRIQTYVGPPAPTWTPQGALVTVAYERHYPGRGIAWLGQQDIAGTVTPVIVTTPLDDGTSTMSITVVVA